MKNFFENWLSAWTGNNPENLLRFYSKDAFYSDPHLKEGIKGEEQLRGYFAKLLAKNPKWVWTLVEYYGSENKYYLKWNCEIPVGSETFKTTGLDLVWIEDNKITRNEVYFDTSELKKLFEARKI